MTAHKRPLQAMLGLSARRTNCLQGLRMSYEVTTKEFLSRVRLIIESEGMPFSTTIPNTSLSRLHVGMVVVCRVA